MHNIINGIRWLVLVIAVFFLKDNYKNGLSLLYIITLFIVMIYALTKMKKNVIINALRWVLLVFTSLVIIFSSLVILIGGTSSKIPMNSQQAFVVIYTTIYWIIILILLIYDLRKKEVV